RDRIIRRAVRQSDRFREMKQAGISEKESSVDKVKISFNAAEPLNPVALEGDPGFLYVIMPIRKH
ncbi:MAG: hypothetical protein IJC34_03640, partial [Lentisphaeria bacterium]|nr:hypothetical protein [Lentisphaeria bacterium]